MVPGLRHLRALVSRAAPRKLKHKPYEGIVLELAGLFGDVETGEGILLDLEGRGRFLDRYETLVYLLDRHPTPHYVNHLLCREEAKRGIEVVRSYPEYAWLDLSSVCNVECRFCKYTTSLLPARMVSLDEVKAIEWLPYVRGLNFSAGTGESLTNHQFVEIVEYVRSHHGHLHLSALSNGKALNERVITALVDKLDALHVSMNASNEEDYHRTVKGGRWPDFEANMKALAVAMKGAKRTKLSASFVMMRWNLQRAEDYLEFAARHGASFVMFHHYYTPYIHDIHGGDQRVLAEKFPRDQSLYAERELSDETFARLEERAKELGVEVAVPPPFSSQEVGISYGVRSLTPPSPDCIAPWSYMYFLWGIKSKREEVTICCGLAADIGAYFSRQEIASKEGLMRLRNSPILRAYRRTANGSKVNPVCQLCREIDRFDPNAIYPDQREFFHYCGLSLPDHFAGE